MSGNPGSPVDERRDERRKLADLLEANAATIGAFATSPEAAVRVIALMLRLNDGQLTTDASLPMRQCPDCKTRWTGDIDACPTCQDASEATR